MSKNLSHLSGRQGLENNLFDQLGIAARPSGTPDTKALEKLQQEFLFGQANIHGTVSFYDFLKEDNKGKKIFICNGSSCMTADTQDELRNKISQEFDSSEIGEMCCLGRCHENSSFQYEGRNYSGKAIDHLHEIISGQKQIVDQYTTESYGTQVITVTYPEPELYYQLFLECLKKRHCTAR